MTQQERLRMATAGSVCGILAVAAYLAKTFVPLPGFLSTLCWLSFGPLVVAGILGLTAYFQRRDRRPSTEIAKYFGVLAGAFHLAMTAVQSSNLYYMRRAIRSADTEELRTSLNRILDGVFTVQLGLGFCWDVFIALSTLLFGFALLRERPLGRLLGMAGLVVGAVFTGLKLYTFPVPPAEAGYFDLGPGLGVWFLLVSLFVLTSRSELRGAGPPSGTP